MPESCLAHAAPEAQALCASEALVERGRGRVFDVLLWGHPARAFALRFEGKAVAYLNRCAHVPTELDWQEGEFFDAEGRWILCSVHGARYEPSSGRCVEGPCRGEYLRPLSLEERAGRVSWWPDPDVQPIADLFDATDPDALLQSTLKPPSPT